MDRGMDNQAWEGNLHFSCYRRGSISEGNDGTLWLEYIHTLQQQGIAVSVLQNTNIKGIGLTAMPYEGQSVDMYDRAVLQDPADPAPMWPQQMIMFENTFTLHTRYRDYAGWFQALYFRDGAPLEPTRLPY
jgi:hypothetical protein